MTVAEQMTRSSDMAVSLVLTESDTPEVTLIYGQPHSPTTNMAAAV